MHRQSLTPFAWLSIAAALVTIGLKAGGYVLTGSVGLLSDALESLVNLAAAGIALAVLTLAARPPDTRHAYGHNKAEYFSSGIEGILMLIAAAGIGAAAWPRLMQPRPIIQIGPGLAVSVIAAGINLIVACILLRAGRRHRSITLEADASHLLSDVWTSAGVVLGVGATGLTGWLWLDPLIALLVAVNIVRSGMSIVWRSVQGLLDAALPAPERAALEQILEQYRAAGIQYHALRTRQAGSRCFVSVHILVPGMWSVQESHRLLERIEREIQRRLPGAAVFTHLEPLEDPASWEDLSFVQEVAGATPPDSSPAVTHASHRPMAGPWAPPRSTAPSFPRCVRGGGDLQDSISVPSAGPQPRAPDCLQLPEEDTTDVGVSTGK